MKIDKLWFIIMLFSMFCIGGAIGSSITQENIIKQCNHLKANKQLIYMDSVFKSKDTIIRYYEDGSRLEFYPSPYKNLKYK